MKHGLLSIAESISDISMEEEFTGLQLMHEDIHVLTINFDSGEVRIHNEKYLPFTLRNTFKEMPEAREGMSLVEIKKRDKLRDYISSNNKRAVISWAANRVLSLSRKNAKWIYNLLKLDQLSDDVSKAKVALLCRAVSVLDNYWVKLSDDKITWNEVNIRHVPLNEVIAQVALHGSSLSLQGSLTTPELTTNGVYAKAWRRYPDGSLWLHKLSTNMGSESRIEVMVSNLLDKTNAYHCHYEGTEDCGKYVCACPAMTSDDISILSGMDFTSYCNKSGLDVDKELIKLDKDNYYKMWIVDYLISNRDRHSQNWGVYYNPHTMEFISMHPLFDHNNAFDNEWIDDPDAEYQFSGKSIRECAKYAMRQVDFHFIDKIVRSDFLTTKQYNSFMSRAAELGVKIVN